MQRSMDNPRIRPLSSQRPVELTWAALKSVLDRKEACI